MSEHTSKAFDSELTALSRKIAEMGGIVEQQVADAIAALTRHDIDLARRPIAADPEVDRLQREVEEQAILTIARRQPMAVDLRDIVGALRVITDLERVGDHAKNIAKRVIATAEDIGPVGAVHGLERMTDLVLGALRQVLDAYARRDVEQALGVWRGDAAIDAAHKALFGELLAAMMADPRSISVCTHLLFCAKNVERMGDHATNIAETVYYVVKGVPLDIERPKYDAFARS